MVVVDVLSLFSSSAKDEMRLVATGLSLVTDSRDWIVKLDSAALWWMAAEWMWHLPPHFQSYFLKEQVLKLQKPETNGLQNKS